MEIDSLKKTFFVSPTFGSITFQQVFEKIIEFVKEEPTKNYSLIVGSDSFPGEETVFVTAIIIHRKGSGGRYFYRKIKYEKMNNLKLRIFTEASLSLEIAEALKKKLSENGVSRLPVEIHIDVGKNGATRILVKEVIKMIVGSGYIAVTKPDSFGATKVADRHTN
ncbi:MAG TPA: ribonuclease H-like YkuK family protein [Thermodesulfovibrio thiophilus]|uniref:ribonuclease H-like YkuK family protein n=1 Tax=Thermodesulfovibrio thiophilus TaxID=340095 RepID=UPI0003FC928D|nr:ribonuclease H-like YkuK family protein [Thermodesulfovibrio thiophilus]HOA82361.1 ribonuclease H-like YkuK family protein [Thermodesulfovibrio thiophilus]HQA03619.1 ribonuclease H-like YkuK family protein [Thermodesulfovibrio thiophilus]